MAVFTLQHILKMRADAAHASAICIILPLSTISAIGYIAGGAVEYKWLPFVVPAFFAGGILGAKLLGKISGIWLNRLFSFLMLLCAVFMVVL